MTTNTLQDTFLGHLCADKTPVTVFLANGVKLQGFITSADETTILLRKEAFSQLVYKRSISTILPLVPVDILADDAQVDEDYIHPEN